MPYLLVCSAALRHLMGDGHCITDQSVITLFEFLKFFKERVRYSETFHFASTKIGQALSYFCIQYIVFSLRGKNRYKAYKERKENLRN